MNIDRHTITLVGIGAVCTAFVVSAITTTRTEKKRENIKSDLDKSLAANRKAKRVMMKRINDGEYDFASLPNVIDDFNFESIIAYNGMK